jgi:uncharacterized protein YkwD
VLHSVKNLLDNPFETKFWKIKLENKAFHSKVGRIPEAMDCMFALGFQNTVEGSIEIVRYDKYALKICERILQQELVDVEMQKSKMNLNEQNKAPLDSEKEKELISLISDDELEEEKRPEEIFKLNSEAEIISLISDDPIDSDDILNTQSQEIENFEEIEKQKLGKKSLEEQLKELRKQKHQKYRRNKMEKQRVITLSDIEKRRKEEEQARLNFQSRANAPVSNSKFGQIGDFFNVDRIGRDALEYTNQFRHENNLPPLKWHQGIADIGKVHSKDMGEGKVPFGHQGFQKRVNKFPVRHRGAAENVAMNSGTSEIARVAVNGWIDSPYFIILILFIF